MWFFVWFLLAFAVGLLASNRGRSGIGWFLVACLISPLLGAILVLVSSNLAAKKAADSGQPGPASHVRCASCAEWVLPQATSCKHCRSALTPDPLFGARQAAQAGLDAKMKNTTLAVFFGAVFVLLSVLAVVGSLRG